MITSDTPGRPRIVLIAGPTASGKSARALDLAEREDGVIVNADASQVYRDLRILTARPSVEEEARAPHRLYGYIDAADACSAARWADDARKTIAAIIEERRLPILVGGTGLYFRTLIDGIAPVPAIDPDIRADVRRMQGPELYAALQQEDGAIASRLHPNDTSRLQRALETIRSTGRSIASWRANREGGIGGRYRLDVLRTDIDAEALALRCDRRAAAMLADGAIPEVAALARRGLDPALPAMRAIGVAPIMRLLDNEISADDALAAIRIATRQYAKRQRTWFRNQSVSAETRASDRRFDG